MDYRIYGYADCRWCQRAKALLEKRGVAHEYQELATAEERVAFLDEREIKDPNRTFPRIYALDGGFEVLLGGFMDLAALDAQGGLDHLRFDTAAEAVAA